MVVVGGGSAGVAAAVCAARAGCTTLLVERSPSLGGNVTHALVHSICGTFHIASGESPRLANGGFALEFARRLVAEGSAQGPLRMGRMDVLLQEPAGFARLCETLVAAEPLLELVRNDVIASASVSEGRVHSLTLERCGRVVHGKAFVDATGDATLAQVVGAGVERVSPERLQRPAYIFGISGVDPDALEDGRRLRLVGALSRAIREKRLPQELAGAAVRPTCVEGQVRVSIDLAAQAECYDPLNELLLAQLHREVEGMALVFVRFLKETVPGFEKAQVSEWPARLGIRESGRMIGLYQMRDEDVLRGATFEDAVCVSAWPVEMRETASGPRLQYPEGGRSCEVPLRALRSRDFDNLLAAGRCISCTHTAHAALRVIGTCLATGQAAGLAAAEFAGAGGECGAESESWLRWARGIRRATGMGTGEAW